jgi:hypothetical protein
MRRLVLVYPDSGGVETVMVGRCLPRGSDDREMVENAHPRQPQPGTTGTREGPRSAGTLMG